MLRDAGCGMDVRRVARIWRRERLEALPRQPGKGRLRLNDGSCIRLRPGLPSHVFSCDFVES